MFKNFNFWIFAGILVFVYVMNLRYQDINRRFANVEYALMIADADLKALFDVSQASQLESERYLRIEKNRRVWQGTGCAKCHVSSDLALPINNISVSDAMYIVRNGTQKSKAGGMPIYSSNVSRDSNSISDADLRVRLEILYDGINLKKMKTSVDTMTPSQVSSMGGL